MHRRFGSSAAAVALVLLAAPATAGELPEAYLPCLPAADAVACSEILARHCYAAAGDASELTACRAALADALEAEYARLRAIYAERGPAARALAARLEAGAERAVTAFCAAAGARMEQDRDARCRLMALHLKVYHLTSGLLQERDT